MAGLGRIIASRADLYGPSTGAALATTQFKAPTGAAASGSATRTPQSAIPVTQLLPQLQASIVAQPILWLFGLIGILIGYKLIEEKRGSAEEFSEVKVGLNNTVKVGLMVMLFFVAMKFLTQRYSIPGVSSFVQYATGGSAS
jgi:hypothetical protein